MRSLFVLFLLAPVLGAQVCAPAARLGPAEAVTDAIDDFNCRTAAGAAYAEYSLVLPTRGQIALDAASDAFAPTLIFRDAAGHALATGSAIRTAAEGGAYTVIVATASTGQKGAFNLRSAFTPDPDGYCRHTPAIGLHQTVNAHLAAGSCGMPDGSRYDAYNVTALGAGTLDISLQSADFTPYLILRGDDGHALAAATDGHISYPLAAEQRYTVVASASGTAVGAYSLKLVFTPADGDLCRPVKTFTGSGDDSGKISPTGCAFTDISTGSKTYYNYYAIQVSEPGLAQILLTASGFNPSLYLLDESGSVVTSDSWSAGKGQAMLVRQLRPGNYTVLALSSVTSAADYTVQYTFQPGTPVTCPAVSLNSGDVRTGNLAAVSSCRTREGIADVYQVTSPADGTLEMAVGSNDFTPVLALRDARESRIVADEYANGSIAADLPAGSYSIVASTADGPGGYTVAYRFTPRTLPACPAPTKLDAGYIGMLGDSSCRSSNGQPADYYEFTTPADGTTALTLTSQYLYGHLALADTQGNVLRQDENAFGNGNALLVQYLPAGTYRVAAAGADGTPTGYYQLMRYFAAGAAAAGCRSQRSLVSGDSFDAQLNFTACQFTDDTFADFYRLELAETSQVQIGMDSSDFDAYLMVLDAKGNIVAEDDDSAPPTNARLNATLDAGTYLVLAKTYSGYAAGTYHLSVAAAPAAAAVTALRPPAVR